MSLNIVKYTMFTSTICNFLFFDKYFVTVIILATLYLLLKRHYSYWENLGVPGPKPLFLVGNLWECFTKQLSYGEVINELYKKYEGYPFVGIYRGLTPCLLIRDVNFIKNLSSKDFKYFQNNDTASYVEIDPILARHPTELKDEIWRKARSQYTPFFTSSKLKNMFSIIEHISKKMVDYVEFQNQLPNPVELESKELCTLFAIDIFAACVFGLEANCFEDHHCELRYIACKFVSVDTWIGFKQFLMGLLPNNFNFLKLKLTTKEADHRITRIVKEAMKYRKENNVDRNDMFQIICQLFENYKTSDAEIEVVSLVGNFFFDEYETGSQAMSFVLYEIAKNSMAQEKLREEINKSFVINNNQFTYESIQEMRYLDACCNEALRLNPGVFHLSKICNQRYEYTCTDSDYKNISVVLEPNSSIIIPIGGLHMDLKYYESPEQFIPERFLNKENIKRYIYMPFGEGPRQCVGKRLALLQIKIGLVHLLKNFEIKPSSKTKLPIKYDTFYVNLSPIGGLWLNFYKI